MALSSQSALFVSQLGGIITEVEDEGNGTRSYKLVPTTCYHQGQRFPFQVEQELKASGLRLKTIEGLDYFMVPDLVSVNALGKISHYAQRTPGAKSDNYRTEPVQDSSPVSIRRVAQESPDAVKRYITAAEVEVEPEKPIKKPATKKPAAKKAAE